MYSRQASPSREIREFLSIWFIGSVAHGQMNCPPQPWHRIPLRGTGDLAAEGWLDCRIIPPHPPILSVKGGGNVFDFRNSKSFKGLDPMVQESILHCGLEFRDEEELIQYARQQKQ